MLVTFKIFLDRSLIDSTISVVREKKKTTIKTSAQLNELNDSFNCHPKPDPPTNPTIVVSLSMTSVRYEA